LILGIFIFWEPFMTMPFIGLGIAMETLTCGHRVFRGCRREVGMESPAPVGCGVFFFCLMEQWMLIEIGRGQPPKEKHACSISKVQRPV
jgi:hypothetical protein